MDTATVSPCLFGVKPTSKRKRAVFGTLNNNTSTTSESESDSDNSDFIDACTDSSSSSSTTSTASSASSTRVLRKKHSHKVLVTEEKMADALRDLQIEMIPVVETPPVPRVDTKNRVYIRDIDEEVKDEDDDESSVGFYVTDELKTELNGFKRRKDSILPVGVDSSKMQLVPWSPSGVYLERPLPSAEYEVEEPCDFSTEKTKLKRTYSQLNQISIEEMKPSEYLDCSNQKPSTQFYIVDYYDEDTPKAPSANTTRFSLNYNFYDKQHTSDDSEKMSSGSLRITEVEDDACKTNDEEKMDI